MQDLEADHREHWSEAVVIGCESQKLYMKDVAEHIKQTKIN